ncbi:MAG: hypothetical protein ACKPH1_03825, partial [Microcystis panniformis]
YTPVSFVNRGVEYHQSLPPLAQKTQTDKGNITTKPVLFRFAAHSKHPTTFNSYQISQSMTDIHARMLAKPAFVVTRIKKNGILLVIFSHLR